jgi:hypothetical protein
MNCKDARNDTVLAHYGELGPEDRLRWEAHLRHCPGCRADREETARVLALVTAGAPAEAPALDGEQAWRKIRAGLRGGEAIRRRNSGSAWRFGWAGAGATLVLVAGILIGRFGFRKGAPEPLVAAGPSVPAVSQAGLSAVSLQPSLAAHLEDLRPVLLDFAHSVGAGQPGAVISVDERLLRGLMLQNLLLRRALNGHDPAATELLDDLDLVLKEIVNAKSPGGATPAQVRGLIKDRGILFRMQVLKTT